MNLMPQDSIRWIMGFEGRMAEMRKIREDAINGLRDRFPFPAPAAR